MWTLELLNTQDSYIYIQLFLTLKFVSISTNNYIKKHGPYAYSKITNFGEMKITLDYKQESSFLASSLLLTRMG